MSEQRILTKEFSLAGVLGTISGYTLVDRAMDEIQELIEWITGQPVFTHQIPYVMPDVKKALVKQFPNLKAELSAAPSAEVKQLVAYLKSGDKDGEKLMWGMLIEKYGAQFQVAPMQPFDEFEPPPLITPNIEGKALPVVIPSNDEFPSNI